MRFQLKSISTSSANYNHQPFKRRVSDQVDDFGYQPNFVLMSHRSLATSGSKIFGDILPIYPSQRELINVIVTSWDSFIDFILFSRIFGTCILSFVNTIINNSVYQSYLIVNAAYQEVLALPDKFSSVRKRLEDIISAFTSAQTRDLWWLEFKLDLRLLLKRISKTIDLFWQISQKFYLAVLVFVSLGVLNLGSIGLANSSQSFLSTFLNNYSFSTGLRVETLSQNGSNLASSGKYRDLSKLDALPVVTTYQTKKGDTVELIANNFGVTENTIRKNNGLSSDQQVSENQTLNIPFGDGLIYTLKTDMTPQEIEANLKVPAALAIVKNDVAYIPSTNKFPAGTTLYLATDDWDIGQKYDKQVEETKRLAEEALRKSSIQPTKPVVTSVPKVSTKALGTADTTTLVLTPSAAMIEPVNYTYMSRGWSPGHHGCDLATPLDSVVVSPLPGVVDVIGYETGGYGNYMTVAHGGGLSTLYAHLDQITTYKGQVVKQGEQIALSGSTGASTGPHVHWEVKISNSSVVCDPYLPSRG